MGVKEPGTLLGSSIETGSEVVGAPVIVVDFAESGGGGVGLARLGVEVALLFWGVVPAWCVALTGRRPPAASSMTMVGTGELA